MLAFNILSSNPSNFYFNETIWKNENEQKEVCDCPLFLAVLLYNVIT